MMKDLIVVPKKGRKEGQVIAFLEEQLCFFENDELPPVINQPIKVMVTRPLYRRRADGFFDPNSLMALMLRPVTDDYEIVSHDGFACWGTICMTTAKTLLKSPHTGQYITLTPGRTSIKEVDWVNCDFYKTPRPPKAPGFAYVKRHDWETKNGPLRIEGLPDLHQGDYSGLVKRKLTVDDVFINEGA